MFEVALCVDHISRDYLDKNYVRFRDVIMSLNGILNFSNNSNNAYFLIAVQDEDDKIKKAIADFICDCIRDVFKREFILENIKVSCKTQDRTDVLLEALLNFDRINDDEFIKNRIKLSSEFYIYSFYQFKLAELRTKWLQLVRITNQSGPFLKDDEIYVEVIKYLIDGIELGDCANVEKKEGVYIAKIEKNNLLCKIDNKTHLLSFLIKNNPRKITVENLEKDVVELITLLFGQRVVEC